MQMRLGIIVAFGVVVLVAFPAGHPQPLPLTLVQQSQHATHGRELIASSGCLACHKISGFEGLSFSGPRLDNTGAKLRPEWLRAWLHNPRVVSSRSRMGDFRLSITEVAAIEAFLLSQQALVATLKIDWQHADPVRGRALFTNLQCAECHGTSDGTRSSGSPLSGIREKVRREWLAAFLRDPQQVQPGTPMSRYTVTDAEIGDLAAFLLAQGTEAAREPEPLPAVATSVETIAEGQAIFERSGCVRCHQLAGVKDAGRTGPFLIAQGHTYQKLLWPEAFADLSRMPTFNFTRDEAADIEMALR